MSAAQDRLAAAHAALTAFNENDAVEFAELERQFLERKRAVRDEYVTAEADRAAELEAERVANLDPNAPVAPDQTISA